MKRIAFGIVIALIIAGSVSWAQAPGPGPSKTVTPDDTLAVTPAAPAATEAPSSPSEGEKLTAQVNELLDQLAVARAQRGDCEATLAPLEARARQGDSQQRWADQKAAMEKARPGYDCNARTLSCTRKPEPPKAKETPKPKKE